MGSRRLLSFVIAGIAVVGVIVKSKLLALLTNRPTISARDHWSEISNSPGAENEYPPQGMTYIDGELVVSNHWQGECSCLYRIDPVTGEIIDSAMMPEVAKHTSGLTWDGESLWAIDHASNILYRLDKAATFRTGEAVIEARFDTGLLGSSGLTSLSVAETEYLAVSDFLWTMETAIPLPIGTARTYVVPVAAVEDGQSISEAATVEYDNGGYSQGLTWDGSYLYESVNMLGVNKIELLNVEEALTGETRGDVELVGSFEAPGYFVEDLGTDGKSLWTTDEFAYGLYELADLDWIEKQAQEA